MNFSLKLSELVVYPRLGRRLESAVGEETILIVDLMHKTVVDNLFMCYVLDDNYRAP